ncbi:dihydrolipoyl dehydrogenase [Emcibacter sp.]|uniref:dihydrolipoyl dehydrogenase n=1 Tax=Emcibacter sp. TaxID=1979954 RepID=UPI002AA61F1B|nr:dihydrolipoyl dehydrogenase [Emcibacter sp.]
MTKKEYDIVVIGGGPGGYVSAIRAAQLGLKTAVVEREHLGGICLNWGCIPTKALLRTAEISHLLKELPAHGFTAGELSFDLATAIGRSRKVAGQLSGGVRGLLKKNKVTVIEGEGRLTGPGEVSIGREKITARHIIIATGARARELPHLAADGDLIWTYRHALSPKRMPKKLLVIGSGAIGMEFASFYQDVGAEVTVVEALPRILPNEDEAISALAEKIFSRRGISLHRGTEVAALEKKKNNVTARLKTPEGEVKKEFDTVLLAIGIVGNIENLGLETAGVKTDRGHIVTDPYGRTNIDGIYAIGDVAGPPWLAHKASHEGVICVEKIAGHSPRPLKADLIPSCTYSRPQVASIGLTEQAAREKGHEVRIGEFPFVGNGKAVALGETDGLIKTIFDAGSGELLGAHLIGPDVTELVQGFVLARKLEATEEDLMETVFAHPTLSEAMHESVLAAYERAIHL